MKQLDLFAAFASAEVKPVTVPAASPVKAKPRMSPAEVRKCLEAEVDSRLMWLDRQLVEWEKKEIAAGRAFVSKKYRKMLMSY